MVESLCEIDVERVRIRDVDSEASTCLIEFESRRSPRLEGMVLEGAWSFGEELLVALTSDCVHEESLYFYLLDDNLEQIDKITLLWPYRSGVFELQSVSQNRVFFKFSSPETWLLEVHRARRLRFPVSSIGNGVWRPFSFFSRLSAREAESGSNQACEGPRDVEPPENKTQ